MKKYLLAVSAVVLTVSASYATEPGPGEKVLEEFRREFPSAEKATWSRELDFDKVVFLLAGSRIVAYFDPEGELAGSVREILYDQLPLAVMTSLDRRFRKADIIQIREIINVEGTHYRIRLDSGEKKYKVQVHSDGNIADVDRVK